MSYAVSLAQSPEVRTSGSFADPSPKLQWAQPRDLYQGQLYHHSGKAILDGKRYDFEPWDLVIFPPSALCEVIRDGDGVHVYNYFTFVPCEMDRDRVSLPVLSRLGHEGPVWDQTFRKGLNRQILSRTSIQATVYALLWSISQPESRVPANVFVERAEELMRSRLSEPLRIAEIAAEVGISQSQLARLFIQAHGLTPLQFLLDERARLARRLLSQTTIPIKQVARSCGLPDPHAFNRFVNDRLGSSPRKVRAARGEVDIYRVHSPRKDL